MFVIDVIKPDRSVIGPFDSQADARVFVQNFLAEETEYEIRPLESIMRYV